MWYGIGIAPSLQTFNVVYCDYKLPKNQRKIFQNFVFQVKKALFKTRKDEITIELTLVFPRINIIVSNHR